MRSGLIAKGFSYAGKEFLTCGVIGLAKESYVFIGSVYYQRLKHMVYDKIYGRARGPRLRFTKQPSEGRSSNGGLRIGEMERDCIIGYGSAELMYERLMLSSDQYSLHVCSLCGVFGFWSAALKEHLCGHCMQKKKILAIKLPYPFKLLVQELHAVNISSRFCIIN
jgi:DNA-directed RNA polymerase III subunit RPC2